MPIIYHERQNRQLCALHTLNNLFQEKKSFTKEQLDEICKTLSPNLWINPHCSLLGLGNYDVNVLMTALQKRNCEAAWFDKRKDPACINLDAIVGFILNVPSDYKFGIITLPLRKRHWIAVRRIDDKYYNLDSKLQLPDCIGNEEELLDFLRAQLETNERELFVIIPVRSETSTTPVHWLKEDSQQTTTESSPYYHSTEQVRSPQKEHTST